MTQNRPAVAWNPATYLAFAEYRAKPVEDLLPRIHLKAAGPIYDLGCGPGNVTAKLHARWPDRTIFGLDSSRSMLAAARREFAGKGIIWQESDIAHWVPLERGALIFANAALHWLGDHAALFPRLMAHLANDGVFAVQMPVTGTAPYHECIATVQASPKWSRKLSAAQTHEHPLGACNYYDILRPSAGSVEIWETHYHHVMPDLAAVVEWCRGTALAPYLSALSSQDQAEFLGDCTKALGRVYAARADGHILFTMRRIFILASRR